MTLEKSVLTNYTSMSLDERFTQLRRADSRLLVRGISDLRQQFASPKSRRLALQMSRRPSVIAALNTGRAFGGSLGRRGGQIARGTIRNIGRGRRSSSVLRGGNRPLRRSGSIGRLARSQSLTSLNSRAASPFRARGRGRGGRNIGGRGGPNRGPVGGFRRGGINQRGGGRGRGGGFVSRRGRGGNFGGGGAGGGGFGINRGRGRGEARRGFGGGGRGRGRGGQRPPPPSKEKLDMELDEYMASSRATLDKEIDTYMSQTQEKWE